MSDPESFAYKMRKHTRRMHGISDAMVNAKFAMALDTDVVWAEGLLVFYEIFRFLEEAMSERKNENLGKMCVRGMLRSEAFEADLKHYYGEDWKKTYEIRESVGKYLSHLKSLLENDSDMLIPYVYHLYMGLLSGGQILRKKRELKKRIVACDEGKAPGGAVTDFGDFEISTLKNEMKNAMNSIAETMDEDKKSKLLEEGNKVFELNNSIIRTVASSTKVLYRRLFLFLLVTIILITSYMLLDK